MKQDHLGNEFKSEKLMCDFWKINQATYKSRIQKGMSVETALTTPIVKKNPMTTQELESKQLNFEIINNELILKNLDKEIDKKANEEIKEIKEINIVNDVNEETQAEIIKTSEDLSIVDLPKNKDDVYTDLLEKELSKVRDAGIASKILLYISRVRNNADLTSARRWIWELIQNATDVAYEEKAVDIKISMDGDNLEFSHTGKPFTIRNILSIINQISSKTGDDSTVGMFGTGFVSTHQLSEVVQLSGIIKENSIMKKFSLFLDRSGKTSDEVLASVDNSIIYLKKLEKFENVIMEDYGFNTKLIYSLKSEFSRGVALNGIDDLKYNIGYVLATTTKINSVTIEINYNSRAEHIIYKRKNIENYDDYSIIQFDNSTVDEPMNDICLASRDGINIMIPVENKKILPLDINSSKLLIDFPLVGSENFKIPFVVSCRDFNSVEERNFIHLSKANTDESNENKILLEKAMTEYNELLKVLIQNDYSEFYNIVPNNFDMNYKLLDEIWFTEKIFHTLINYILNLKLFEQRSIKDGKYFIVGSSIDELVDIYNIFKKLNNNYECDSKYDLIDIDDNIKWNDAFIVIYKQYENFNNDNKNSFTDIVLLIKNILAGDFIREYFSQEYSYVDFLYDIYSTVSKNEHIYKQCIENDIAIIPSLDGKTLLPINKCLSPKLLPDDLIDLTKKIDTAYENLKSNNTNKGFVSNGAEKEKIDALMFNLGGCLVDRKFQEIVNIAEINPKSIMEKIYDMKNIYLYNWHLTYLREVIADILLIHQSYVDLKVLSEIMNFLHIKLSAEFNVNTEATKNINNHPYLKIEGIKGFIRIYLTKAFERIASMSIVTNQYIEMLNKTFSFSYENNFDFSDIKCFPNMNLKLCKLSGIQKYTLDCVELLGLTEKLIKCNNIENNDVNTNLKSICNTVIHMDIIEPYSKNTFQIDTVAKELNNVLTNVTNKNNNKDKSQDIKNIYSKILEWINNNPSYASMYLPNFSTDEGKLMLISSEEFKELLNDMYKQKNMREELKNCSTQKEQMQIWVKYGYTLPVLEDETCVNDKVDMDISDEHYIELSEEDKENYILRVGEEGQQIVIQDIVNKYETEGFTVVKKEEKLITMCKEESIEYKYIEIFDCDTDDYKQSGYDLEITKYNKPKYTEDVNDNSYCELKKMYVEVKTSSTNTNKHNFTLSRMQVLKALREKDDYMLACVKLKSKTLEKVSDVVYISNVINDINDESSPIELKGGLRMELIN